jgi:cytochrome c oxidase subunit 1
VSRTLVARFWIALACVSLLLSGGLAIVITGAKIPGVQALLPDIEIVRWCLVTHVNLATLVWFTAVPVGLLNFAAAPAKRVGAHAGIVGPCVSALGIAFMVFSLPGPTATPVLTNYIPVVLHPQYLLGLGLYLLGAGANFLSPGLLLPAAEEPVEGMPGLAESRFGLWMGSTYFVLAVVTLGYALATVGESSAFPSKMFFELVMWGCGHLLQHSSSVFLVVCWIVLLSSVRGQSVFTRRELFPVFAWLGLPILFLPFILWERLSSDSYRDGFTALMRWGIFPPVLFLAYRLIARNGPHTFSPRNLRADYRLAATGLSILLLALGFVFGALIRGPDLRIPGHYHATIGAVTVAFMAACHWMLSAHPAGASSPSTWITRAVWTYGGGQMLFSSGMFVAGTFGLGRKTYGSEHVIKNWGQTVGMGAMAIGGLCAFSGGLFFAFAIVPRIKELIRSRAGVNADQNIPHLKSSQ